MYVLIMILMTGFGADHKIAIATAPGFTSQELCDKAAYDWMKIVKIAVKPIAIVKATAYCEAQ
jgi:hypothetical protein